MRDHSARLDCGHPATPRGIAAGYATTADGRTACYGCADSAQAAAIETAAAITLYDSGPTPRTAPMGADWLGAVTTWTGGVLARVIGRSTYRNGLTGTRMTALTVRTAGGRILHGRYGSDWSQAVTLRPSRAQGTR